MEKVIVKTNSLSKHYHVGTHTIIALDGVDFEVKEREFVSIIGKSGCGKSTLLHIVYDHFRDSDRRRYGSFENERRTACPFQKKESRIYFSTV